MMNLIYNPKDILQKEFKTKMRGYSPEEVDEFLDNVIKDYEAYNKEILKLQEENKQLVAKLEQAAKIQHAAPRNKTEAPRGSAVTNFDILKRLSNLESEVFGKKLGENSSTQMSQRSVTSSEREYDPSETRQF